MNINIKEQLQKLNDLILSGHDVNIILAINTAKNLQIQEEFEVYLRNNYLDFADLLIGKKSKNNEVALQLMFKNLQEQTSHKTYYSSHSYTYDFFEKQGVMKLGTNRFSCTLDTSLSNVRIEQITEIRFHKFGIKDYFIAQKLPLLKNLRSLHFDQCTLQEIPLEITALTQLQYLSFEGSKLKEVSTHIGKLVSLEKLSLKNCNQLQSISGEVGQLKKLQSLDLYHCINLLCLPDEIGDLEELKHIELSECKKMTKLPSTFGGLKNITNLHLRELPILALPSGIGKMKSLISLHLDCPLLEVLPNEIGELTNLEELTLNWCEKIKDGKIPVAVFSCLSLKKLIIRCNSLKSISPKIGDLQVLEELFISGDQKKLSKLPEELFKLSNLKKMTLIGFSMPAKNFSQIKKLNKLTELTLALKKPKELPTEINELKQLVSLTLYHATKLPVSIEQLPNLENLDLSLSSKNIELSNVLLEQEKKGELNVTHPI